MRTHIYIYHENKRILYHKWLTIQNISMTRLETTIDAVFSGFLLDISSVVYASYFSYYKPLFSFINCSDNNINNNEYYEITSKYYVNIF